MVTAKRTCATLLLLLACVAAAEEKGWFIHITDTHLHRGYREGSSNSDADRCIKGTGSVGRFGDWKCDNPSETLASAWAQVGAELARHQTPPDFVLWTGDHISVVDPNVSQAATEFYLEHISDSLHALRKQLPAGTPIVPILGNHDSFPAYQFPESGPFFVYEKIAKLWADFLSPDSLATLRKGMFYTELLRPGLRAICVNTPVLWGANGLVDPAKVQDPAGQFAWIRETLGKARAAGEKVFVITHLPIGRDQYSNVSTLRNAFNERLLNALDGFSDVIAAAFCGHLHLDSFRVVKDSSAAGGKAHVWFTTSSVTARPSENPSFAVFTYSKAAPFTLLDKAVHYFDLESANANKTIVWKELYSMAKLYGMKDIGTESMVDFATRLFADDSLFEKYWYNIEAMAKKHGDCKDAACRKFQACVLTNVREADFAACLAA